MSITGKIKTLFSDSAKTEALFPRTKTSAVSDDDGVGLNVLLDEKADVGHTHSASEVGARPDTWMPTPADIGAQTKHTNKTCTLTTAGWSSLAQTVSVSGVTASNTVVVTPAPASHAAYGEAGVYCSAQASGKLTFKCTETPIAALTVNVLILN